MTVVLQPVVDLGHLAPYDQALHCVAGFFASEDQAKLVAGELRQRYGLHDRQGQLLGPAQASWLRFHRQARSWTLGRYAEGRSGLSDAPLMALFGGVLVGLLMLIQVALNGMPDDNLAMLVLLTSPLVGAAAGWMASTLSAGPAQHRRFNRHIRSELAAGRWVVLAHHVPAHQRAGAAALLREQGVGWCATSAPWRQL